MQTLQGKTLFITGGSRGIGLAIALRAARDGASVAIAAKTTEPHPKLPGTLYTAAEEIADRIVHLVGFAAASAAIPWLWGRLGPGQRASRLRPFQCTVLACSECWRPPVSITLLDPGG